MCAVFLSRQSSCDLHFFSGATVIQNMIALHSIFLQYCHYFLVGVAFFAASVNSIGIFKNHQKYSIFNDFHVAPAGKSREIDKIVRGFPQPSEQLRPSFLLWSHGHTKHDSTTFDFFALPPPFPHTVASLVASVSSIEIMTK